jgi:predicted site-specific integrase-resolvase
MEYAYGLRGIRDEFNVSHATAQKYKDGILKDAVMQNGRKIILDEKKARELFANNRLTKPLTSHQQSFKE